MEQHTAEQRPHLYLDWLQRHLLRLAAVRGWPSAGFEQAYAACLADDARLVWRGLPKTSPHRRFVATPEYHFDEEGDCWASVDVQDRADGHVIRGGPWDCFPVLRWVRRSARTLRWIDSTHVGLSVWPAEFAAAWDVAPDHILTVPDSNSPD